MGKEPTTPALDVRGLSSWVALAVLMATVVSTVPAAEASGAEASATEVFVAKAAAKLTLVANSLDGSAFDFDEYSDGDVSVQVTSSAKKSVDINDTRDLKYYWTIKPFAAPSTPIRVPATGTTLQTVDLLGSFVAPLPPGQPAGSYTLSAGIAAGTSGVPAIPTTALRTVKVGDAALTFTDASPLRTEAGTNRSVKGSLKLQDGTGLSGRLIDLSITRGTTGSDPAPDAGIALLATDPSQPALQVTTSSKGGFAAVLKDAVEAGQGTEVGDVVDANTAATPSVGNAAATQASLTVDFVSDKNLPVGTTAVLDPLTGGTPGEAHASALTITAPDDTFDTDQAAPGVQGDSDTDRDPLVGQVYTMSLDHGFFTSGQDLNTTVADAPVGNLENLGTTLTGITDATGTILFQVSIARDTGFDDDGKVTTSVSAVIGGAPDAEGDTTTAVWDSTSPLNGRVDVVLSAPSRQQNPVDPAISGDRAYYDVLAVDQFGNRAVEVLVTLIYTGDIENWDYSDDSTVTDFTAGSDIWLTSFEPGTITTTGTWVDAPTTVFVDTAGTTAVGTADTSDSTSTSFYNVAFGSSKFSITSTATDVVAVGTPVTQTVKVLDQLGNPVRGYDVQFFRFGPTPGNGRVQASGRTNALGEVSYTFIGTTVGLATITAFVTDRLAIKDLAINVRFGSAITASIAVGSGGSGVDQLTVSADGVPPDTGVRLYRVSSGKRTLVAVGKLSTSGTVTFSVKDRNGSSSTSYIALVQSTSTTAPDFTSTVKLR